MNEDKNKESGEGKNRHYYGRIYPGIWLIVIGTIFLLNNFGYFRDEAWGKLWPIFIIIPGVLMLLRSRSR